VIVDYNVASESPIQFPIEYGDSLPFFMPDAAL
jgi:hypothetical protein